MSPGTNQFNVISSQKSRPVFCDVEAGLYISHILGPQPTQTLLYGHNKKKK
jgi:hypothetical protein